MKEQLEARLAELQRDFDLGERQLRDVEAQQAQLRDTLLRISGAIQVLRELLGTREGEPGPDPAQPAAEAELVVPQPGRNTRP